MKLVQEIDVKNKKVLLRTNFDVKLRDGKVVDGFHIKAVLPTIEYLQQQKARVLILSHLGRPKAFEDSLSLQPIADYLGELLKQDIVFFKNITDAKNGFDLLKVGQVAVLENLRFNQGEEKADKEFAISLAELGEVYINDAFAGAHREHASTVLLPKLLPHAAGFLIQNEVDMLDKVRTAQDRPLVFIMGGAKAETKFKILVNLFDKVDHFCLGGVMANLVLKEKGVNIGKSHAGDYLKEYMGTLDLENEKIQLIEDALVGEDPNGNIFRVSNLEDIKENEIILDIGPRSIEKFSKFIKEAGTVVWNGPMGFIENDNFRQGSLTIAQALKNTSAKVIVGGGETAQIINEAEIEGSIDYQSTGGGAMLQYLANGTLPAIEVLE
ncbi:MAG: phosphoglycerate kinase [Candidatus Spechtbacteria bacterium RIFCSPLOWO2_12_FULL_38_22]|uniref:Phosphoglycerate kinase n=1 Tax=Candidatus Spechtbacteria bacterium RIFCSPLOWO2_12_FULL_38_22 TaxID=1802165 RepID=A0A1G2HHM7_9BACT|nr:MAG: phosphoglycerate kinase [Candidatus Spechtbacteria bacterium RIFCSPHIGHO2_01_FULL_38_11]OGZ59314.1 MAG: phosphoglycerate kinase [Candidatus Spechtbacteria bacterium RIFCSPHIGHO2_12_FULL_38_30]OGZ59494.1 MAG: phosphoglycerate kinase [Candidatus Spechtbacteria bacterium RIFCSPLOWO2_01_FULL_38_20]OGZ61995.1 MAG: phosphoglycerate kinase [Candidatus Spechtbacteria bacterium RIFCSPLOWO2_12_FULL_38_22]